MENRALAVTTELPAHVQAAVQAYGDVVLFVNSGVMRKEIDYGIIPGTGGKPTLYKPGAEKLCKVFKLYPVFTPLGIVEDWESNLFHYRYSCNLVHRETGEVWGAGIGSCNSREKKYRYRTAQRVCPKCGQPTIFQSKKDDDPGFYCWAKKGGCGAKFGPKDATILSQEVGQTENPDIADLVNTLDKMAQKRALIAATLVGCAVSEFFTQDVEDLPRGYIDGDWREEPAPDNGNGHTPVAETQEYADAPVDSDAPMQPVRPYSPRTLLEKLTELVAKKLENPGNEAMLPDSGAKELAIFMRRILPNEDERHAFLRAAFNVDSSKALTYAEDAAIRAWIGKGSKVELAKREADDLLATLDGEGRLAAAA